MRTFRLLTMVTALFSAGTALGDELDVNTVLRGSGGRTSECHQAYLPSAGHLTLDVTQTDPDAAEPRIDFLGAGRFVEATASSLWIEVADAGDVEICVAVQDPRRRLADYKLRVAFAAARMTLKGGDPAESEVDPDPLVYLGDSLLDELCLSVEVDDYADVMACATSVELGGTVGGEIANAWADDEDTFVLSIGAAERPTVEIEITAAEPGFVGELYGPHGHRLAADVDNGDGVRLVRTLSAGLYFVRVHGGVDRASGAYHLSVGVLDGR